MGLMHNIKERDIFGNMGSKIVFDFSYLKSQKLLYDWKQTATFWNSYQKQSVAENGPLKNSTNASLIETSSMWFKVILMRRKWPIIICKICLSKYKDIHHIRIHDTQIIESENENPHAIQFYQYKNYVL